MRILQFLFNTFNHNDLGQRSLEDIMGIMGHQLRALGHHCVWQPENKQFLGPDNGVNIVIEGFTPGSIEALAGAKNQGARFVILATEEPHEKGFNQGTQKEMIKRQVRFPEAAKLCEGILHLVPGEHVTRWYGQFAPTAQAELGYSPSLVRKDLCPEPRWDFGFYGSVTPRRLKILKKLARRCGTVKLVGDFKTQTERDEAMQHSKVLVQVRKFEAMGLVSSSRCNTALMIGRPVIAEPHLLSKPWDEIVRFSKQKETQEDMLQEFFNLCLMAKTVWRGIWQDQVEKFKTKLSPEICIGQPLVDIGVLETPYAGRKVAA